MNKPYAFLIDVVNNDIHVWRSLGLDQKHPEDYSKMINRLDDLLRLQVEAMERIDDINRLSLRRE